jgi:hypothetical protein
MNGDPVEEAVQLLRPYREKYREAVRHLRAYAELCEDLRGFDPGQAISDIKAEYIFEPSFLMLEALYRDIEDAVRAKLGDQDFIDGPVVKAAYMLTSEEVDLKPFILGPDA